MRSSMLMLLALLILSYGVNNIGCSTLPGNGTDMLSLIEFKAAITSDPEGALSSWNTSISFCHWNGVTCSRTHPGRITMLDLAGRNLAGPIDSSLGNLTFLRVINLSRNGFSGEVPHLNRLHKLEVLKLANNSLVGIIPDTLMNCSNLQKIHLEDNLLVGEIPPKIGLLSNLLNLVLYGNNLTGIIPRTLSNISQLQAISFAGNQITGGIPSELGQLSSMWALLLGENRLSGGIPDTLLNLTLLRNLGLEINMLDNALPSNIGNAFPKLEDITLNDNMFEGQIPASLGNALGLGTIDLSQNMLTGLVPSSFGMLQQLQYLNLEENNLVADDSQSWEFFGALSNCSSLQVLSLSQNQLQGVIPYSVGKLSTKLEELKLDANHLVGIVPSSIGNLSSLTKLVLGNNSLTGELIEEWIGKLTELQYLDLHKNNFIGPIPSSIGNLTQLELLSFAENEFSSPMPSNLGYLQHLLYFNLSYNILHGNVPIEFFNATSVIACVLSHNNLEGPIPPEISNLKQLSKLDLSSNKLTGGIPYVLGKCQELDIIRLDQNFLTGNIPASFGDLPILSMLNLSHNNLSGFIPAAISGLQVLNRLDLSYNHLDGEIPKGGVFANATAVSLNDNWGLCGGSLNLNMSPCPSVSPTIRMQYYLVRTLIPIFGFLSLLLLIYLIFAEKNRSRKYPPLLPFGAGNILKVSYTDLAQATGNFCESNLVGRGSHGSVYKGKLIPSKMEVAVKVLDLEIHGAERSFLSECEALRSVQHRNLVSILTTCSTVDNEGNAFKALIYEFMPNGNLDTWLHHKGDGKSSKQLDLETRMSIAVNIADVLDYLHNDTGRPIIHCDLKPSNILLDDDMTAHLGDFGIASLCRDSSPTSLGDSTSSIGVKGTIGYIAPEYAGGGHASTCGDVYSFGIVLLEMLTGKRPTDNIFAEGLNIVSYVEGNFNDRMSHIIDASLELEIRSVSEAKAEPDNAVVFRCLFSLLQVALSCASQLPDERISMREAAARLHAVKASYIEGKDKYPSIR